MIGLSGAVLFQYPITGTNGVGGGCGQWATDSLLSAVDFCYIFDCDNGFFGGAVQPCGDASSGGQPFLLDCSGATPATTTEQQ